MSDQVLTFRACYGSCTFRGGSTRVNGYIIHTDGRNAGKRMFPKACMEPHGRSTFQEAGQGGGHGVWTFSNFVHCDGTLVLVQASSSRGGRMNGQEALVLRLRDGAPLISVTAHTTISARNLLPHVNVFQGRADILTPKEANLLGARLNVAFIEGHLLNTGRLLESREIAPSIDERPTIRKERVGRKEKTVVDAGRRKRKIRMRRP